MQTLRPPARTGRLRHSVPTGDGQVQRWALAGTPERWGDEEAWAERESNFDLQEALYLSRHCTPQTPWLLARWEAPWEVGEGLWMLQTVEARLAAVTRRTLHRWPLSEPGPSPSPPQLLQYPLQRLQSQHPALPSSPEPVASLSDRTVRSGRFSNEEHLMFSALRSAALMIFPEK